MARRFEGTVRRTERTVRRTEAIDARTEAIDARTDRYHRCPAVMHRRPARTHRRTAETFARTVRTRRCLGEIDGDPARTDLIPEQSSPSTGRTSGRSPRTDRGTAEIISGTGETFIALD
jgi:hypothetical protein